MPDSSGDTGFTHTVEVVEITETKVEMIGIETGEYEEVVYDPYDGIAKWFRDELHQLWVKFVVELEITGEKKTLVIPASRVTFVQYPNTSN